MFNQRIKGHHRESFARPVMANEKEFENFLNTKPQNKDAILYIHIPFCDNICSFCNLNRSKLDGELDEYTDFLLKSLNHYAKFSYIKGKVFKSIYFGGGTPTILKESQLERILTAINENFNIAKDAEFSSESTLHNLSLNKIKLMENLGINRYSIGIQTFCDSGRKLLNRVGSKKNAMYKLAQIKDNFNGLVCTDIIYNYPNQTVKEVIEDAKILKNLEIDSSSFYSLQFQEGSAFLKDHDPNYYSLQTDYELHNAFLEEMLKGDYEILEYTKINKKNRDRYLYIRLSHKGVDILPIGVGAGGKIGKYGIFNMKKDMKMLSLNDDITLQFAKFSALFQYDKINLSEIKSYLDDETFESEMKFFKECEKFKYLNIEDGYLKFSIDGVFWGNTIASKVIQIAKPYFLKIYQSKGEI